MMETKLHYVEKGQGYPLVLLHGNGEDSSYFRNQIRYFSRYYRVIAIDTRGHGKSPRGKAPFRLEQFAADLKEFLDKMELKKIHLLGFSDGGNIALLFAIKHPGYVDKLILNGANIHPAGVKARFQIPLIAAYYLTAFTTLFSEKLLSKKEMMELMVREPCFKERDLQKVTMPVLVIVGNNDMIRHSHSAGLAKKLPSGRLCVIRGDHFIALREWKEFNRQIERFLKE